MNSPETPPTSHVPKPTGPDAVSGEPERISVCLTTTDNGYLKLSWAAYEPDKWDWVGVYKSVQDSDAQFVDGQWQWATKGSSYVTGQVTAAGYQARYLRWNAEAGAYRSLLRTAPFPGRVEANDYDMARWMKELVANDAQLSTVTLPGTHDSAAWGMYLPATNTQGM